MSFNRPSFCSPLNNLLPDIQQPFVSPCAYSTRGTIGSIPRRDDPYCCDCRSRGSFPPKRPHVVGATCGQVCGTRSTLDGKPGLSCSDPLGRSVAVGSASFGGSMPCSHSSARFYGICTEFGPAWAFTLGGHHVAL